MKREPSLHIYRKDLVVVLKSVLTNENIKKLDFELLGESILKHSKHLSLTNRQLKVDNAKLLKSTSKVVLSTRDDAGVFASLLHLIRKKRNHRGINRIKVNSKDWLNVKEIASLAIGFCRDFNLTREDGYKIYINLALDKMNKFSLSKFNSLHQNICDDYEALEIIKLDITENLTIQAKNIYEKFLGEMGIVRDYSTEPSKYIYFIKAKEEALKCKVSIETYMKSQFEGLQWANTYPDPVQLVGKGAIDRLNKYLVKNKIKPNEGDSIKKTEEAAEWLRKKWLKNKNKK